MQMTGKFYQELYLSDGTTEYCITMDQNEIIMSSRLPGITTWNDSRSIKWEDLHRLMRENHAR